MSESRDNIMLLLGGLAVLVLGIGGLVYGAGGWLSSLCCILCILGMLEVGIWLLCLYRDWKNAPRILSEKERQQAVELSLELPWPLLEARFRALAARDDTVWEDDSPECLVWSEYALIAIYHTAEDGWLALHWVSFYNPLSEEELAALCRRHGLSMQEAYREKKATGVAFYREGKLTLYPAAFEEKFRRCFLERALAPEAEFQPWAKEYYEAVGIKYP